MPGNEVEPEPVLWFRRYCSFVLSLHAFISRRGSAFDGVSDGGLGSVGWVSYGVRVCLMWV
jgi:hypothetical protein